MLVYNDLISKLTMTLFFRFMFFNLLIRLAEFYGVKDWLYALAYIITTTPRLPGELIYTFWVLNRIFKYLLHNIVLFSVDFKMAGIITESVSC